MSTGLRITQVVLLLIGVITLYGCGSADNTDNNNNNMAEQNLSSNNCWYYDSSKTGAYVLRILGICRNVTSSWTALEYGCWYGVWIVQGQICI